MTNEIMMINTHDNDSISNNVFAKIVENLAFIRSIIFSSIGFLQLCL